MKRLPLNARRNIDAAMADLRQCHATPHAAPHWIQEALRHVTEANQWIVARQLKELTPADLKPNADAAPAGGNYPAASTAALPVRHRETTSTRLARSIETPPWPAVFH